MHVYSLISIMLFIIIFSKIIRIVCPQKEAWIGSLFLYSLCSLSLFFTISLFDTYGRNVCTINKVRSVEWIFRMTLGRGMCVDRVKGMGFKGAVCIGVILVYVRVSV